MAAVHRELANHLCQTLEDEECLNAQILVVGKDAKSIAALVPNKHTCKTVVAIADISETINGNKYDALVANDLFRNLPQCKTDKVIDSLLQATRLDGIVQVHQYLYNSKWNLSHYSNFFESHSLVDEDGKRTVGFKIIWEQGLICAITSEKDWRDHCWMLKKVEVDPSETDHSQREHLDRIHYSEQKIWKYEWIFGHGFMSPGGATENGKFLSLLNLKPTNYVLDIGSGVGGNALQISKEHCAQVLGVDLSSNTVRMAYERAAVSKDTRVRFLIADVTSAHLPPASFDVAYSRDAILHIADKQGLFEKVHTWLKPGGQMLVTDYMTGDKDQFCDGFKGFMACREFTLRTLQHYVDAAKKAGFAVVEGTDITGRFKQLLEAEIERAEKKKDEFLKVFPIDEYNELVGGWRNKIQWIESGDLKWGMVKAVKQNQ